MSFKFLNSYIETALWSSTDDNGIALDDSRYSETELAPETRIRFAKDCEAFKEKYLGLIAGLDDSVLRSFPQSNHDGDRIAHDFWLTRNRHGAGFWDGDYPEPIATQLTDLAHSFGECDLFVGDDRKFHIL